MSDAKKHFDTMIFKRKKLILHVGMHKTGSSSIQAAMHGFSDGNYSYLQLREGNHSSFYIAMFHTNAARFGGNQLSNRSRMFMRLVKARFWILAEVSIRRHSRSSVMVSSGEQVLTLKRSELHALKTWALRRFEQVEIVAYVRPPISRMQSSIQQRVAGNVGWSRKNIYPNYRAALEKFDDVFGQDNVTLRLFARDALHGQDVLEDFTALVGFTRPYTAPVAINQARSLEATAALQAKRLYGKKWVRYAGSVPDNKELVACLQRLGDSKLKVSKAMAEKTIEENASDLAWIENRLGVSLRDADITPEPSGISTPKELAALSPSTMKGLAELISEYADNATPQAIAHAVDALEALIRAKNGHGDR